MQPFFRKKQIEILEARIKEWLGTPYCHMGASKGGVDCAKFIGLILVEMGFISEIEDDYYPRDWHLHGNNEILINSFKKHGRLLPDNLYLTYFPYSNKELLLPGDVLTIAMHKKGISNHAAIILSNNRIVHCLERRGIFICQFSEVWQKRTKFIFRLYEK